MNSSIEERVLYLLGKIRLSAITPEECGELLQLVQDDADPETVQFIRDYFEQRETAVPQVGTHEEPWRQMLQQVLSVDKISAAEAGSTGIFEEKETIPGKLHPGFFRRYGWYAAASVVLALGLIGYLSTQQKQQPVTKQVATTESRQDVPAPAVNLATITLAGGQRILLDSAGTGTLTAIGNVQLIKLGDGRIAYKGNTETPVLNTLVNPRGSRVVEITLADGSRVWLNAGSSITYPVAFAGNERKVSMEGEAYFEVAHDASKPFFVSRGATQVQVLGTKFNINAYDDEPVMRVTLLEGSVRVKPRAQEEKQYLLKPGQQSQVNKEGQVTLLHPDMEETMAWKNDKFIFTGNSIQSVMRQLEKWYDVEVEYKGKVTQEEFVGVVSRKAHVSEILSMLGETHTVSFEIRGKKIIVE